MFFDCNCLIGRWPFRPLALGDATALEAHLADEGVTGAIVSNVESLFVLDTAETNARLLEDCVRSQRFSAAPILNLRMRNWPELLEACAAETRTTAFRIHPNYHFYDLEHPAVDELARALADRGMPLVVAPRVFDERLHNPRMKVAGIPMRDILALARRQPSLPVVCVNAYWREIRTAASDGGGLPGNLFFDIAFAEYFKTLETLLGEVPANQLLFGSNAPIHATRAATMKVAWAEGVSEEVRVAVAAENARSVFGIA
jgi:hypothetical protein